MTTGLRLLFVCLILSLPTLVGAQEPDAQEASAQEPDAQKAAEAAIPVLELDGDAASGNAAGESAKERRPLTEEELAEIEEIKAERLILVKDAKARYDVIAAELTEATIQMRTAQILFMNEDSSDEAGAHYRERRNEARKKINELFDAALEVVKIYPDEDVARYIVTVLQHRFERDHYDESTMEAGARLIDGGVPLTYMFLVTARSAMASGETALAKRLYEVLDEESVEEVDMKLLYLADPIQEQFDQEKLVREREAAEDSNPRVLMKTTRGDAVLELYINQAPSTVANFIQLVRKGYYDGLDFYQVMDHLLALTGDDSGNGTGGSGKFLLDEHERDDVRGALAGSLVMAKRPMGSKGKFFPNSASAQFSILYLPLPQVTEQQVVFGRVIEGMDTICELRRVDPGKKKEKNEIVVPPDRVLSMEVLRAPDKLPEIKYYDSHAGHNHAGHDHADHDHAGE